MIKKEKCHVFLSHTSELAEHPTPRSFVDAALDAVREAGFVADDMRDFPASSASPKQLITERVLACDIYVGLLGFRYGSRVRDLQDLSHTQYEFLTAKQAGKTVLVFLLHESAHAPGTLFLDTECGSLQKRFRTEVKDLGKGLVCESFKTEDELHRKLLRALQNLASNAKDGLNVAIGHQVPSEENGLKTLNHKFEQTKIIQVQSILGFCRNVRFFWGRQNKRSLVILLVLSTLTGLAGWYIGELRRTIFDLRRTVSDGERTIADVKRAYDNKNVDPAVVLENCDPKAFSGTKLHDYQIARAFENREVLMDDSHLESVLSEAKENFDLFAISAPSFVNLDAKIESALERGVTFRILLVDHGDANREKLSAFFNDCGREDFDFDGSVNKVKQAERTFLALQSGARNGTVELRWWKGIYLNSFWVRDATTADNSLAHLEITYFGKERSQNPSIRFGRQSQKLVVSLKEQFNLMWRASE